MKPVKSLFQFSNSVPLAYLCKANELLRVYDIYKVSIQNAYCELHWILMEN